MSHEKLLIGRTEWACLPDLDIPAIKAKVDTGARTSALHAFEIEPYHRLKKQYVRFNIHPMQHNDTIVVQCNALVLDKRLIMSSNGHKEDRWIISTTLHIGGDSWEIEVSLSNRDPLKYRMLLGRQALSHRVLIDPSLTCNRGRLKAKHVQLLYTR